MNVANCVSSVWRLFPDDGVQATLAKFNSGFDEAEKHARKKSTIIQCGSTSVIGFPALGTAAA
jgi:hypothetical protein